MPPRSTGHPPQLHLNLTIVSSYHSFLDCAGFFQPQVILLKEGTDTSQGKGQLISNINACAAVADIIRTTLGPRGMDKLIISDNGSLTISNDGATVMSLLDIVHPAAKTLVEISMAQDSEVGDGTTSVVLLACALLDAAKPFIEDNVRLMLTFISS